mmetsp:Transcript_34777/g.107616  ORF Transcript_34777/g.107616 Transcript_34777/m.107616 type:complete len:111 (-) Transcript_34777:209-541(-)
MVATSTDHTEAERQEAHAVDGALSGVLCWQARAQRASRAAAAAAAQSLVAKEIARSTVVVWPRKLVQTWRESIAVRSPHPAPARRATSRDIARDEEAARPRPRRTVAAKP